MRGLLRKDLYTVWAYLRIYLILNIVFIIGAAVADFSAFILYYPCILSGMITMSLIAYEEKERWSTFACTLPVSRGALVSAKYLLALGNSGATVVLVLLAQTAGMLARGTFDPATLGALAMALPPFSLLPTAILLPFIYRFGSERGRLAYYILLGVFTAATGFFGTLSDRPDLTVDVTALAPVLLAVAAVLFAISWLISIRIFRNREL